jgi:hypothetical protein
MLIHLEENIRMRTIEDATPKVYIEELVYHATVLQEFEGCELDAREIGILFESLKIRKKDKQ